MPSTDLRRPRLEHRRKLSFRLALAASLAASTCAPAALAAPRCISYNAVVPVSLDGLYVNLVNGLQTPTSAGNPGWDFNPFYSGSLPPILSFAVPPSSAGMVASNGVISLLPPFSPIGPSSTFVTGAQTTAAAMANFRSGVFTTQFLGLRLEEAGNVHYGSALIHATGPAGNPARLVIACVEMLPNTPHPAGDGSLPVTLQQFSID